MTRALLAAIALASLCHAADAQLREAMPCTAEGTGTTRMQRQPSGAADRREGRDQDDFCLPGGEGWLVSETTSPVDYSPQVSASNQSHATAQDAPSSFTIRCRLQRIELSVSTAGNWKASTNDQIRVAYRIDQRPTVEALWIAARDGHTASFKGDALQLLQSLPDSGLMSISVFDWQGPVHEATFQLDGLAAVRQKVLAACKATPAAEQASAHQRR
jgi:hypothetical protein